jgi:hypothetical protein
VVNARENFDRIVSIAAKSRGQRGIGTCVSERAAAFDVDRVGE